ncbi:MAG: HEAT repeat domain-containing protein [Planctomycetota bacterium]|jgi:hypothetical protein
MRSIPVRRRRFSTSVSQLPLALGAAFAVALGASPAGAQDLKLPKRGGTPSQTPAPVQDPVPTQALTAEVEASRLVGALAELKEASTDDLRRNAAQLVALGDAGRTAARAGLGLDGLPVVEGCLRVLCASGTDGDRAAIFERLSRNLPKGSPAVLLRTLEELRPDWLDAPALASLLDHRQSAMRMAAERQLRKGLDAGDLEWEAVRPALNKPLASKRSDTVSSALEVLASRPEGVELELLFTHLGDARSAVSSTAARLLAERPEAGLDARLLEIAFKTDRLFRDQAMALVALLEREDLRSERLLTESHVEPLLKNLRRRDSALANALAAVALTRIGFQANDRAATTWYEREVPTVLVAELGGLRFHKDYSITKPLAIGALQQWSGQRFGEDGPAWMAWWRAGDNDYRGRRASLDVRVEDSPRLTLFVSDRVRGTALGLVGPYAVTPAAAFGELYFLDEPLAAELFGQLEATGIFGSERIPPSVATDQFDLLLEVAVDDQRKRFTYAGNAPEWTTAIFEAADALARELSWQQAYDPRRYADRRAFVETVGDWWAQPRTAEERREKRALLFLDALSTASGPERQRFTRELALERERDGRVFGDFKAYLAALTGAPFYRTSTTDLIELAIEAARLPGSEEPVGREPGSRLFELVYSRFRETGWQGLQAILDASAIELARSLSSDERPLARALAAGRLAGSPDAGDVERLRRLLFDNDERVEAAAVEAVSQVDPEAYRNELLVRAKFGATDVREAALLACGRLSGPEARAVQIEAMATGEVRLQVAAMRGIAISGDPEAASILVRELGRGPGSPLSAAAEEALLSLGENAVGELLLLASSPRATGRREAALLLAQLGRPEAAEPLIDLLTFTPDDDEVAYELAVLTAIDLRAEPEPARSWNAWWRDSVGRSPLDWFREGQARAGIAMAPRASLEGEGTLQGALSLHVTLADDSSHLAERARRELERLLEVAVGPLPPRGEERELWRSGLLETIQLAYAGR